MNFSIGKAQTPDFFNINILFRIKKIRVATYPTLTEFGLKLFQLAKETK